MKVTIIAGARPNFMKIAPLMRAIKACLLYTSPSPRDTR